MAIISFIYAVLNLQSNFSYVTSSKLYRIFSTLLGIHSAIEIFVLFSATSKKPIKDTGMNSCLYSFRSYKPYSKYKIYNGNYNPKI